MDASKDLESVVAFQTSQGTDVRGGLLRLDRYCVVFELYSQSGVLQHSEVLSEFKILFKDRPVYSGRAVIKALVNTGLMVVCEAALEDSWLDVDFARAGQDNGALGIQFKEFFEKWQQSYKVEPEYKVIIADMQTFLMDLRIWAEQIELGIRSSPSGDRIQLEQDVIKEVSPSVLEAIDFFFEKFEVLAEKIEAALRPVHAAFMKRQLHPYVLCSPFAYRTFSKPLGYAGDYEMVNMIARNPLEGSSLFAKLVNLWFIRQPPAEAHRQRLDYLVQKQLEETARVAGEGRNARIFNVACGPAIEVQRFIADKDVSERAEFTLLDFNEETLQHVTSVLSAIKTKHGRSAPIQFIKRSVHQILKESGKAVERPASQQYDFVYCAGLFDYLSEQVCSRLTNILYSWLAPGGLLLATNVAPNNPLRNGMEHLLDWNLVYRSPPQVLALAPREAKPDDVSVRAEPTGINVFLEVRKPKNV